jgi:RsiW-degrading membrane proteinase PrsW (M82 family)
MALLASILFGFVPIFLYAAFIYWLDRYEKEPLLLLGGVFLWGAVIASAGAFLINTIFGVGVYALTGSKTATEVTTSALSAPLVEETLKGLAVLLVFLLARDEFDSILDGIVYAAVTALGFAATENAYYIYSYGFSEHGWSGLYGLAFVRVILVGWQHPFYTSFTGIGLALARTNRNMAVRILAPLAGWGIAIFAHAFHNTMASLFSGAGAAIGLIFDWTGWLAMFIFILFLIGREKQWMVEYLKDEVTQGTITVAQYKTACSAGRRLAAWLGSLTSGATRQTSRFYQLCAELSHKKRQAAGQASDAHTAEIITRLREELTRLSPLAAA